MEAGRVAQVWGLHRVRVGDWLGSPVDPADRGRLRVALTRLAEQDP